MAKKPSARQKKPSTTERNRARFAPTEALASQRSYFLRNSQQQCCRPPKSHKSEKNHHLPLLLPLCHQPLGTERLEIHPLTTETGGWPCGGPNALGLPHPLSGPLLRGRIPTPHARRLQLQPMPNQLHPCHHSRRSLRHLHWSASCSQRNHRKLLRNQRQLHLLLHRHHRSWLGTKNKDGQDDPNASAGKNSPRNLLVTTIGDQLRLATNFRSKVIGVSLKDRAAIFPAGHAANAAYWMDSHSMNFVSSTYYMKELPRWAAEFNKRKLGEQYVKNLASHDKKIKDGPWRLLLDEDKYVQSAPRNQRWENTIDGTIKQSPWGQTITFDMAKAAIEGENLGHNPAGVADMIAVSISSTDMIGHRISPNSIWMQDTYLRLDRDIADFLSFLDQKVEVFSLSSFQKATTSSSPLGRPRRVAQHGVQTRPLGPCPAETWKASLVRDGGKQTP